VAAQIRNAQPGIRSFNNGVLRFRAQDCLLSTLWRLRDRNCSHQARRCGNNLARSAPGLWGCRYTGSRAPVQRRRANGRGPMGCAASGNDQAPTNRRAVLASRLVWIARGVTGRVSPIRCYWIEALAKLHAPAVSPIGDHALRIASSTIEQPFICLPVVESSARGRVPLL